MPMSRAASVRRMVSASTAARRIFRLRSARISPTAVAISWPMRPTAIRIRCTKPYLEAMFMNDTSDAQIAPGGDFFNTTNVNCDNPLLSAQERSVICGAGNTFVDAFGVTRGIAYIGRRNVEGGPRITHLEHTSWRVVAGMKGDLLKGLSYDTYYQF